MKEYILKFIFLSFIVGIILPASIQSTDSVLPEQKIPSLCIIRTIEAISSYGSDLVCPNKFYSPIDKKFNLDEQFNEIKLQLNEISLLKDEISQLYSNELEGNVHGNINFGSEGNVSHLRIHFYDYKNHNPEINFLDSNQTYLNELLADNALNKRAFNALNRIQIIRKEINNIVHSLTPKTNKIVVDYNKALEKPEYSITFFDILLFIIKGLLWVLYVFFIIYLILIFYKTIKLSSDYVGDSKYISRVTIIIFLLTILTILILYPSLANSGGQDARGFGLLIIIFMIIPAGVVGIILSMILKKIFYKKIDGVLIKSLDKKELTDVDLNYGKTLNLLNSTKNDFRLFLDFLEFLEGKKLYLTTILFIIFSYFLNNLIPFGSILIFILLPILIFSSLIKFKKDSDFKPNWLNVIKYIFTPVILLLYWIMLFSYIMNMNYISMYSNMQVEVINFIKFFKVIFGVTITRWLLIKIYQKPLKAYGYQKLIILIGIIIFGLGILFSLYVLYNLSHDT